jgi:HK97 family phage portal protein
MRFFSRTRGMLSRTWGAFRADMGLGIVGSPSPDSDYWYHGLGTRSSAGPEVSPGTAVRLAAVFACTRVVSETMASLPIGIYRERKSGGRDAAKDHPAMELFLNPNPWQTSMEFFEMMQGHLELRGNSYALKVPGGGRAIEQLIPQHPDRVKVYLLPNGRLRYDVTSYSTGQIDHYSQDEVLHIRGWSFDGITGISTVSAMAEVIGKGLAVQEHASRYFRNNAIPGMSVETVKMTPEAEDEFKKSLSEGFSGENSFKAMILPPGVKATVLGLTNKDSQLIESAAASRLEICAAWRVPPHKIGDLSRGTFSNIEQQNIEFATDCMRPRIVRAERRLDRDIVGSLRANESAPGDYYVTFNMNELYRGDMKSRYDAYQVAIQTWMARNEARANEGLNPIAGLDEMLVPLNMETVSQAQTRSDNATAAAEASTQNDLDQGGGAPETPENDSPAEDQQNSQERRFSRSQTRDAHLRSLAVASAGRVVRREVKAMRKLAIKAQDGPAIEPDIWEFYRDLAPVVAEALVISIGDARLYCNAHAALLSTAKSTLLDMAIDRIEEESPAQLAAVVLGENLKLKLSGAAV